MQFGCTHQLNHRTFPRSLPQHAVLYPTCSRANALFGLLPQYWRLLRSAAHHSPRLATQTSRFDSTGCSLPQRSSTEAILALESSEQRKKLVIRLTTLSSPSHRNSPKSPHRFPPPRTHASNKKQNHPCSVSAEPPPAAQHSTRACHLTRLDSEPGCAQTGHVFCRHALPQMLSPAPWCSLCTHACPAEMRALSRSSRH